MNTKIDEFKTESKPDKTTTLKSLDMKPSDLTSKKTSSSCEQPSSDLIQWPLIKPPKKYSHTSQFNKHLYPVTLKGDTLFQIKNGRMLSSLTSANTF